MCNNKFHRSTQPIGHQDNPTPLESSRDGPNGYVDLSRPVNRSRVLNPTGPDPTVPSDYEDRYPSE